MYTILKRLMHREKVVGFLVVDDNGVKSEMSYRDVCGDCLKDDSTVKNATAEVCDARFVTSLEGLGLLGFQPEEGDRSWVANKRYLLKECGELTDSPNGHRASFTIARGLIKVVPGKEMQILSRYPLRSILPDENNIGADGKEYRKIVGDIEIPIGHMDMGIDYNGYNNTEPVLDEAGKVLTKMVVSATKILAAVQLDCTLLTQLEGNKTWKEALRKLLYNAEPVFIGGEFVFDEHKDEHYIFSDDGRYRKLKALMLMGVNSVTREYAYATEPVEITVDPVFGYRSRIGVMMFVDRKPLYDIESQPASRKMLSKREQVSQLKVTAVLKFGETASEFIGKPITLGYIVKNLGATTVTIGGPSRVIDGESIVIRSGESRVIGRSTLTEMRILGHNPKMLNCNVVLGSAMAPYVHSYYLRPVAKAGKIEEIQCGELVDGKWKLKKEYDMFCIVTSARDKFRTRRDRRTVHDYLITAGTKWPKEIREAVEKAHSKQ